MRAATARRAGSAGLPAGLSRAQLLELYYFMRLTRSLEERLVNLYRQGKVIGGLFRSLGQEADSVGSAYALDRSAGDSTLHEAGTRIANPSLHCLLTSDLVDIPKPRDASSCLQHREVDDIYREIPTRR